MRAFASQSLAVSRHYARVLVRDPGPPVVMFVMPIVIMSFIKGQGALVLRNNGYEHANGAEWAVPGMSLMFGFFLVAWLAYGLFQEHAWRTWNRLRLMQVSPLTALIGHALPALALGTVQQLAFVALGWAFYELPVGWSDLAPILLIAVAQSVMLVSIGFGVFALARTVQQVNALSNATTVIFGGLSGALVPLVALPGWAQAVAPFTPTYWALEAYLELYLEGQGLTGVLGEVAITLAIAAGWVTIATFAYNSTDAKVGWS